MDNPYDHVRDRKSSVLGPTLKFKGELTADEDLLIQGRIEGSIKHSSSLTVGESGNVKANVSAEYIAVEGSVQGDLKGSKSVKVRDTAKIKGNIVSPKVSLVEGATFNGKIDMDTDPSAAVADKPEAKADAKPAVEPAANDENPEAEKPQTAKKSNRSTKKPADAA